MKYAGGSEARKVVDQDSNMSFGDRKKYHYISSDLKNVDDSVYVRFIDDAEPGVDERNFWITLATHDYVPCKPNPNGDKDDDGKKRKWPETMTAICRTQKSLQGEHENCYICENLTKPGKDKVERPWSRSSTTFARAIKREKTKVTQQLIDTGTVPKELLGKTIMNDVTEEVDETGEDGKPTGRKITQPVVYLVQQKYSNFFQQVEVLAQSYDDTILDRDVRVVRKGVGLDTKYVFAAQKETPDFDLRDEDTRAPYDAAFPWEDLVTFIDNLHSSEYYGRFFDPGWVDPEKSNAKGAAAVDEDEEDVPATTKAAPKVDKAKMEAMKARMMGKPTVTPAEDESAEDETLANA